MAKKQTQVAAPKGQKGNTVTQKIGKVTKTITTSTDNSGKEVKVTSLSVTG